MNDATTVTLPLLSSRTLHLMTLCSFAITQPLLTALGRQSVYLNDQRFNWIEIGVLLTMLVFVLPLGFVILDRIINRLSRQICNRGTNAVLYVLTGITILTLLRPHASVLRLVNTGLSDFSSLLVSSLGAWLLIRQYNRLTLIRSWLNLISVGIVVFPAAFLWQFQVIHKAKQSINDQSIVKHPVPIVMVVFDEFSGTTLMNDRLEIDARHFPQFARLSRTATWYRKMTTNHSRTDVAVPTILSGRFPVADRPPLESEYPGNLLQVLNSTGVYDLAVFEPVTRLCPRKLHYLPEPKRTSFQKSVDLLTTSAAVYPRLALTSDLPIWFPAIPQSWFGLGRAMTDLDSEMNQFTEGTFHYAGGQNRTRQMQHFLDCLIDGERPRFAFQHLVFPHLPWSFFDSGQQYLLESSDNPHPSGAVGELGEDWLNDSATVLRNFYRYRMQAGFADRYLGQILDRLKKSGLLNECLLIVTADHGVSFRPGHSRRIPDADNLADILSVPLFIKLPGQTAGLVDDRNVESVDLLPTIAEVAGFDLPEPTDGTSVTNPQRRTRKSCYFNNTMTIVEPDFPQQVAAVRRQSELFGDRELSQAPNGVATSAQWHGQPISRFKVQGPSIKATLTNSLKSRSGGENVDGNPLVPSFITGCIDTSALPETPAELVVAVDGIIRDTGTTYRRSARLTGFDFLLPPATVAVVPGKVQLYLVERTQNQVRLRPITTTCE